MCFSAQASFVAGIGLIGLGSITIKRAPTRRELPYALIPLLFGIQQLIEGALWLTLPDHSSLIADWFIHLYSFFSHVLWPIYIPLAALSLETVKWRRNALVCIAAAGIAVGVYLFIMLIQFPVTADIINGHIRYDSQHTYALTTMILYLIGTCASLLFSSHLKVVIFGAVAFLFAVISYAFYTTWFFSVWCFFAAVLSIIVLWHFQNHSIEVRSFNLGTKK